MNYKYLTRFPLGRDDIIPIYESICENRGNFERINVGYTVAVSEHTCLERTRSLFPDLEDRIALLITGGGWLHEFPIHADGRAGESPEASINIALRNCDSQSTTTWFDLLPGNEFDTTGGGRQVRDQQAVVSIEEVQFHSNDPRPFLFRSGTPHKVVNRAPESGPRVMFVWRFRTISWEESLNLLAPYING